MIFIIVETFVRKSKMADFVSVVTSTTYYSKFWAKKN